MSSDSVEHPPPPALTSDDTLLLLNRATLVMHTVRTVVHELNNVFQMIGGSAELLEMHPDFPPSLAARLATISRQTARGRDLADAIADLARTQPAPARIAGVAQAVERAMQLRKYEHARSGIELTVALPAGEPLRVRADPLDLQLMLLNLLINAEQALTGATVKTIDVAGVADGEACRITVTDSGAGVLPEGDYFAPLVTTRSPRVAAGLGLGATRLLALRHGGDIVLRQSASGVEAVLTLPRE